MYKTKIGIVGIGNMGSAHAECIAQNNIEGMCLNAVCDISEERLGTFSQKHPDVKCFNDYNKLFESGICDSVIVAVPHRLHSEIAVRAFEYGLNVLVEKPADISVSKAKKLNEAAKKSGKVFAIMFNQRTNPLYARAREIVKNGQLGEIKRSVWIITNWFRTQSYYNSGGWRATWSGEGGGVLLNQAPHNLDLWQWICGMPESVTGFCDVAKYHNIEVEDDALIFTRYKNGATGIFITSTGEYPGTNRLEVSGDLGKLVLENGILRHYKLKEPISEVIAHSNEGFAQPEYECEEFLQKEPEAAHRGILQNFADAVLFGEELLAPGREGVNELAISNAAYLSQWLGNTEISLPFDDECYDTMLEQKAELKKEVKTSVPDKAVSEYLKRWQVRW